MRLPRRASRAPSYAEDRRQPAPRALGVLPVFLELKRTSSPGRVHHGLRVAEAASRSRTRCRTAQRMLFRRRRGRYAGEGAPSRRFGGRPACAKARRFRGRAVDRRGEALQGRSEATQSEFYAFVINNASKSSVRDERPEACRRPRSRSVSASLLLCTSEPDGRRSPT